MDLVQNQDIIIDGHVIRYVDGLDCRHLPYVNR